MPYALVIVGLIMIVSGVRDTHAALGAQIKSDLTGERNFTQYALAIFAVGALGYIDKLRAISTAFMALIIVSLVLSNQGFFAKLGEAFKAGPEAPPAGGTTPPATSVPFSLDNLLTPFGNKGTLLGKAWERLKPQTIPPSGGGSSW